MLLGKHLVKTWSNAQHSVAAFSVESEGIALVKATSEGMDIARVLSELQDAGVVVGHAQGNAQRYRLASPEELGGLVHDAGLAHPPWRLLLGIALCALEMAALEERPLSIQRTEAHKMAERVRPLAEQIRLDLPPATRGEANAWGMMVDWFSLQLEGIAQGTSPAFRVGAAVGRLVE